MVEKKYTPEELAQIEIQNERRLNRFVQYQQQRAVHAGANVPAPIIKGPDGLLHWQNRKQRRALKKKK